MLRRDFCCCILCTVLGLALAWLLVFHTPPAATAQGKPAAARPVSFISDVAPILKETCFACHDAKKRKGKLEMTSYATFRKGGSKEDPVTPGKPAESVIIDVLTRKGSGRMPPKEAGDALPKEKVAIIAAWIAEGAKLDAGLDPKAELLRELRVRWQPPPAPRSYRYPANINALVFTPDGKKVVAGGHHELTIWDAATGKLEKRLWTRSERAYTMLFLTDGKLAVAGGRPGQEGNVRIYDINAPGKMADGVASLDGVNDSKVLIAQLLDTDDTVFALALSADGKKIASGGVDRLVRVWDISAGYANARLEHAIENHADWVFGVRFSPDGKKLVTAGRDKTAKLWDLEAKESVLTFPDHQNTVFDVAITKDGKTGISVSEDRNIRFWHATDQAKQLGKQIRAAGGHGRGIFKIAYHADPKIPLLATAGGDGTVRLWNADSGAALKTLSGFDAWVYAVALSPDGKLVAGGSRDGEIRLWKTADGALVKAWNASPGYAPPVKVASPK